MKLNFKNWIVLSESIQIMDGNTPAALAVVKPNLIKEFNYQWDEGFSSYFIAAYQARREGYAVISDKPSHIGITKTTPIEAGDGTDIAFLNGLKQIMGSKYNAIPYKEGESDWTNVLKKQGMDTSGMQSPTSDFGLSKQPDFKTGSSASQKIGHSISVSKASGSWSVFIQTSNPEYALDHVIKDMKSAAKPLIDNDIIEFYEIAERMTGKRVEVQRSKSGQQMQDDHQNTYQRGVGYLKYLAETMLKTPNTKQMVLNVINGTGVNVRGGGGHPALNIDPANHKVPLNKLSEFITQSYAGDEILQFFVKALKSNEDHYYKIMDKAAQKENSRALLYYADKFINDTMYRDAEGIAEGTWGNSIDILQNSDFFEELFPSDFSKFKSEVESGVENLISSGEELTKNDIKKIKKVSEYIKIDPRYLSQIDQTHAEIDKQEKEALQQRREAAERQKHIIYEGNWKYMMLEEGDVVWKDIPDRYINYHNELDYEHFIDSENLVDSDDIVDDANEKAMEDAYANVEERPSERYGKDKDEVLDDLQGDMDDFISDEGIDVDEDISDEDLFELLKNDYYRDYVSWKIDKLKEEEDSESWKYEPEPDNDDIRKYMSELSVEFAFNKLGLVIGTNDESLNFELNSKFKSKFTPILKKTVQIMLKTKDPEFDEPMIRASTKIRVDYRDTGEESSTAYEVSQ